MPKTLGNRHGRSSILTGIMLINTDFATAKAISEYWIHIMLYHQNVSLQVTQYLLYVSSLILRLKSVCITLDHTAKISLMLKPERILCNIEDPVLFLQSYAIVF